MGMRAVRGEQGLSGLKERDFLGGISTLEVLESSGLFEIALSMECPGHTHNPSTGG